MQLSRLLVATLTLLLPSALFAQTGPVDRLEVLGRLAIGESPSYVAHLVKVHALTFSPDGHFLSQVRQAGGEGILVQRLQFAPAPARGVVETRIKPSLSLVAWRPIASIW